MTYRFLNENIENEIYQDVISSIFPSLHENDKLILKKYLITVIDIISFIYNLKEDEYLHQLRQNKYQDAKWLLLHLLPYISEKYEKYNKILRINDIYNKKLREVNINEESPNYVFSNIQYARCKRENNAIEIEFEEEYIKQTFYLFIDAIIKSSNKLYVNWMDILPYDIVTYKTKQLYINTNNLFEKKQIQNISATTIIPGNNDIEYIHTIKEQLSSLYIGDIYNTASNYFYNDIKEIKWLIYDINLGGSIMPLIGCFEEIVKDYSETIFYEALKNKEWEGINELEQKKFQMMWDNLKNCVLNNLPLPIKIITIESKIIEKILCSIIISFDNKFAKNNSKVQKTGYISFNKKKEDEDFEDENINLTFNDVKKSIETVNPEFIYEFLRSSLQIFKKTFYSYNILNDEKTDMNKDYMPFKEIKEFKKNELFITHKNIYNFAKSLVHKQVNGEFIELPTNWCMLEEEDKNEIIKKINDDDNQNKWFNIPNYIKNTYNSRNKDISEINNIIYNNIRNIFIDCIFIALIRKGVLTYFAPNKRITDSYYIERSEIPKALENTTLNKKNLFWQKSFYYLTEKPFCFTGTFKYKDKDTDFFSYNIKEGWSTMYAMDWISQLGFCAKFINNRVTYITGGTGVGKSTQVPKLYMYYLKAIDYNSKGKVVCTQPRINATEKNAERVSMELGLPIKKINNSVIKNDNNLNEKEEDDEEDNKKHFYVQMQSSKEKHVKKVPHIMLKFITDGALILELSNPLIKESTFKENKEVITEINKYDVIMIDEAHEHNKNMDALLTFIRTPLYNNNSVRLVIMSATMDSDEPTYRYYYRDINDNRKYPIDCWLRDNIIDRINSDRRYHISPPGQTTRHIVEDIYKPNERNIDIALNIVNDGLIGDILIFEPGKKEIETAVKELNEKITDSRIIVLPYFGDLNDKKKEFIEGLTPEKLITQLKMDKSDDFNTADYTKGSGNYRNFILVATNIAEASITIPSLKYVIDNGDQKTSIYNYKRRGTSISVTKISESSREQRRGRVGRKSSGIVYYTYPKGELEKNKIQFKISIEDIELDILKYSRDNIRESLFIEDKYDCNNIKNLDNSFKFREDLELSIKNQYYTSLNFFTYYGNDKHYDYNNFKLPPKYYKTGYDINDLIDKNGSFYIVHPDELYLKRNILGKITGLIKNNEDVVYYKENRIIESKKINSFIDDLLKMNYITKDYNKTEFGKFMIYCIELLEYKDINYAKYHIFSLLMDEEKNVVRLISLLITIKNDLRQIITKVNNKYNISKITNLLIEKTSDLLALNEICSNLDITIIRLIETEMNNIIHNECIKKNKNENSYRRLLFDNIDDSISENNDGDKEYKNIIKKVLNLQNIQDEINTFALRYQIDSKYLIDYLKEYYINLRTGIKIHKPNENKKNYKEYLNNIKLILSKISYNNVNKLILTFLMANPFNLCVNILPTNKYMLVYNPSIDNIYNLPTFSLYSSSIASFTSPVYLRKFIHYLSLNSEYDVINILTYINPIYFEYLGNIYTEKLIINNILERKINSYIEKQENEKEEIIVNIKDALSEIDKIKYINKKNIMELIN
jgi:hypothetical protein